MCSDKMSDEGEREREKNGRRHCGKEVTHIHIYFAPSLSHSIRLILIANTENKPNKSFFFWGLLLWSPRSLPLDIQLTIILMNTFVVIFNGINDKSNDNPAVKRTEHRKNVDGKTREEMK